jgi:acyl-CoA thioester hydrolase
MKVNFSSSTTLRVRYGETDQMGYCYYGNYAQYFEVGRVEALREIGMSYKSLEDRGIMLPVADFHVSYKVPAKYDDQLTIRTEITEIRGARLIFNYCITNILGETVANASTILVFVSKKNMRPIAPPQDFIDLMTPHQIVD